MTRRRSFWPPKVLAVMGLCVALVRPISGEERHEARGRWFSVSFGSVDERNAALALQRAERTCEVVCADLALPEVPTIRLVLAGSAEEFARLTEQRLPRWAAGATISQEGGPIIYLPSPRWGAGGADFETTVVHEVAHALVAVATNFQPLPRWLTEGLAIHYSREQQWTSPSQVSRALLTNSLLSLEEIEHLSSYPEQKARLAYQESFLAVQYLLRYYGFDALRTLLTALGQGEDVDAAFARALGKDSWEFEQEWIKDVRRRHRWTFLADADWYLWVFILLLAIGAFLAVRARARRTVRAWTEDEMHNLTDQSLWENH
ncbi:MAG: peptidase MA family metallohydrolase [Candidatus Oleimicrobiaceae bacterium]